MMRNTMRKREEGRRTMETEFMIVQKDTSSDLEKTVQRLLNEGWQIVNMGYAGIMRVYWFAAMVKKLMRRNTHDEQNA